LTSTNQPQAFAPTRWTLVLRARGGTLEARAALAELCEAYYQPVLRFLRRERQDDHAADELAHEFFRRILAKGGFDGADPERGQFRSYLLGALKHFLSDQRKSQHRLKRGGGVIPEALDLQDEEEPSNIQLSAASPFVPDTLFDREWALAVMARALSALESEMTSQGKETHFQALKPWLIGDAPTLSQADAARQLGLREGAVKVAIHRLRKRFGDEVRAEISQTLRDPALVEEELRYLVEVLA
jgi:RNA polymerase sigma-70 factor (ECF subfamily)